MVWIGCFPAKVAATTPAGAKPMDSLRVGDDVRVVTSQGQLAWSKVAGWLHREPNRMAPYLRITTSTRQLTASDEHLIGVVQHGQIVFVQAQEVQAGATLLECDTSAASATPVWGNTVQRVDRVMMDGVFAPLTMEGTIVVDGVGASCYAATHSHKAAHAAMKPMRHMYRHNPEKMEVHTGSHIAGSHKYVDMIARVTRKV